MKRILSLDGGGLMGIIPAVVLERTEALLRQDLSPVFDLVAGTSTGSIIGAMIAKQESATKVARLYRTRGPGLFDRARSRNWWVTRPWEGKYKRTVFLEEFARWLGGTKMGELPTLFMATSVSLVDGRTHYFKSDDSSKRGRKGPPDSKLYVLNAVARSGLSAPYYFEPVDDPQGGHVWVDGGTGTQNCPLEECIIESVRRGWAQKEQVKILSLGTGYSSSNRSYKKAAGRQSWKAVQDYLTLARRRSIPNQMLRWVEGWSKALSRVSVKRVDTIVPEEINVIDGAKHADRYEEIGEMLARRYAKQIVEFLGVK